ncbi:hypothetical protein AVEN_80233-1 [Araneus ventricosus]|uniref:Uncharacterized protein n=1 Tax=Araneus ventricosus TaxID=182803 RepID=A0A4Y2PJV4_ARAVE|nr:hypothetical protein AVEN_80233-1 [Araneus ventricosus]
MAALIDDSRIVTPHLPSLSHLSRVSVALPLLNEFGIGTLDRAVSEIQLGNSTASNEGSEDHEINYNRAMGKLLLIPPRLRKSVLEAVHGMHWEIEAWRYQHSNIFKFKDHECFFHWRSEGTIDTIKMAQQLVLDQNINIRKRFQIACNYCLMKSVRTLWAEMEASGKTKCFKTADSILVRIWVRWLREGSRIPWTQAAAEYLDILVWNNRIPVARFSAIFSSLRPEDRKKFLIPIQSSLPQDFRLCIYSMTKEEQEEVVRENPLGVLYLHLDWPLQNLFLETAEKIIDFIDARSFRILLRYIVDLDDRGDFDYRELFRELWNRIPDHLKRSARRSRYLRMIIDSCFDEIKRKGNDDDNNEPIISKRKSGSDTNRKNKSIRKSRRSESSPFSACCVSPLTINYLGKER